MGASTFKRTHIVLGKDGAGQDFKAFGDTSGAYIRWDHANDKLIFAGGADMDMGSFGTPLTLNQSNNYLFGIFGDVSVANATGTNVERGIWSRVKVSAAQTGAFSIFGGQLQFRWADGCTTLGSGTENAQYAGAWLYLEQDTTGQALADYAHASGVVVQVETFGALTIPTNAHLSGVQIESRLGAANGAAISLNSGTIAGVFITKSPAAAGVTAADWPFGIFIEDCTVAMRVETSLPVQFRDANTYISSSAASVLDIVAATAIKIEGDLRTDRWQDEVKNTLIGVDVAGADGLSSGALHNTGIGYQALYSLTLGTHNVAIGGLALYTCATADKNTAVGFNALKTYNYDGAGWNVAVGYNALGLATGSAGDWGMGNVAVGSRSGDHITYGAYNIVIGYQAGDNITTADHCIIIGNQVDAPSATTDAQIKIGGSTAEQGYILGDGAGDMTINAIDAHDVHLAVADVDVVSVGSAVVAIVQPTTVTLAAGTGVHSAVTAVAAYTGWALGYWGQAIISNTEGNAANAAGGCFEINVTDTHTGGKSGIWAGIYVGCFASSATAGSIPTAGIYIENIAGAEIDMSDVPMISLVTSGGGGAGEQSAIAFEFGNAEAAKEVSIGAGGMWQEQTIRCVINGTAYFIPMSTGEGTYTTAYPIISSYSAGSAVAVTSTAPTTATNAISSAVNITDGWASGEINAIYGKVTITPAAGVTYSAAGGHFELEMVGNATSGHGLLCGAMVKFTSDLEQPNAILYLESYPTGSCDLSETPFITFCDYKSGSGVKSNTLFRIGDPMMAQAISTGSGKLSYNQTLRCALYDTPIYLVTSTEQGTYTTAYPIESSSRNAFSSAAIFVPSTSVGTDYVFAMGTYGTPLDVTYASGAGAQHFLPFQMNVTPIGADPESSSSTNLMTCVITHDTLAMPHGRLKCTDFYTNISKNVLDAYVYQGELNFSDSSAFNEAAALGLCVNASSGTVAGKLRGIIVQMQGASQPTDTMAIEIRNIGSGATIKDGVMMNAADTITNGVRMWGDVTNAFAFEAADTGPVITGCDNVDDREGSIKITVAGVAKYLHYWPNAAS